jgi:hypothetical protein
VLLASVESENSTPVGNGSLLHFHPFSFPGEAETLGRRLKG